MKDLIKALQIFCQYKDDEHPTTCSHGVRYVHVDPSDVSGADRVELGILGFEEDHNGRCFYSDRFGSA